MNVHSENCVAEAPALTPAESSVSRVPLSAGKRRVPSRLSKHMQCLQDLLGAQLGDLEPEIRSICRDAFDSGGKRFRAALVFFSGWRGDGRPVSEDHVRAAAVIEIVHLATLVHDDVLDGGTVRRSRQTVHERIGQKTAVLLGDALFAQALHMAASFPDSRVCREVAAAARRVCSGEIIQTLRRNERNMDHARYLRVLDLKTAELYSVSCSLGAWLGGYPPSFVKAAARFGRHLGIAYQMADDILDLFGNESAAGKTLGSDFRDGKATLPVIVLHEMLETEERKALWRDFGSAAAGVLDRWRDRMLCLNVLPACVEEVTTEFARAESALNVLPADLAPLPRLRELLETTRSSVKRWETDGRDECIRPDG